MSDWSNKFFRRLVLLWSMVVITVVLYVVYTRPPDIPDGTVTLTLAVLGLLSIAIGLYQWLRTKEDKEEKNRDIK